MKRFYLFFTMVIIVAASNGQGTNCNNAISIDPKATCIYQSFQTPAGSNVMWFFFVAESTNVNISVVTTKFGINAPHIHQLALGGGTCGNIVVLADDELPFEDDADKLSIDLNASGLIVGQTYFIRVKREATDTCDKVSCKANNSTDPTVFDLCVENVNVIIPLDFGLEAPDISHSYLQNRGQLIDLNGNLRPEIKQYTIGANPAVYISDTSVSYVFSKIARDTNTLDSLHRVDMTLEGASTGTRVFKTEQIPGITNFFLAHVPKGITRNKSFSRAVMNDVYPNIDMQFYSNAKGVKYYFIVRPGGNADNIVMKFDGATAVNVTSDSSKLEIISSIGTLDFEAGHAYQINPGNQIVPMPWQAKFIKTANNKVKLDIRNYSQNMPLFIQIDRGHNTAAVAPSANNNWSTYFGQNYAHGLDIATDSGDSVYVTGFATNSNFPTNIGLSFQPQNNGENDVFIAKFKDAVLQWVTFYGSDGNDYGYSIDAHGKDVYIVGYSNSLWWPVFPTSLPTDSTYWQNVNQDTYAMGIIIRLNSVDGFPKWATFFGGAQTPTKIYGVAIAKTGLPKVFITGTTRGNQFPLKQSPYPDPYYQTTYNGIGITTFTSFISCFNPDNHLSWSTFFGSEDETGWDITVNNDDVYIVGETYAGTGSLLPNQCLALNDSLFPLCNSNGNSYIQQLSANSYINSFIARFSQNGQLKWSSLVGGNEGDYGTGVAVNSMGDVYMAGYTFSDLEAANFCDIPANDGFPLCNPVQSTSNANYPFSADLFISKFNSTNQLAFSTFYGGTPDENGGDFVPVNSFLKGPKIAIDWNNNIFLTGPVKFAQSDPNNAFPTQSYSTYYYQDTSSNPYSSPRWEAYIVGLNSADELVWSTLYGGGGNERGAGISTFKNQRLYINGSTTGPDFPTVCPSPTPTGQPYCVPSWQPLNDYSFITRFDISTFPVTTEEKVSDEDLQVYPNPAANDLYIITNINGKEKIIVNLFNSIGKLVKHQTIIPDKRKINTVLISDINDGIYLLQLQSGEKIISKKIIKINE